jgi:alpha-glucosidase (family GH31 glycosyl hydrolase)
VVWAGDQRTSYDTDDGFPTVLAMGIGMSASGIPVFAHDIAGYQSVGNDPSNSDLWFRWASLGAWSPIMRTHHGAYDLDNWQFDSDDATTEHWAAMTDVHGRLFPYLYGLAALAESDGTPMILPISYVYGDDWGRTDAWLLGAGVLVAPVTEGSVDGRQVDLPPEVRWWRYPEMTPAEPGFFPAAVNEIPVFLAEGSTLPMFAQSPDTWVESDAVDAALITLAEVDVERIVYLVGGGGPFTEADGTSYKTKGSPTGPGEVTVTLTSGEIEVAGVTVEVTGSVERSYTFVVID